jgi:hypothetical protein
MKHNLTTGNCFDIYGNYKTSTSHELNDGTETNVISYFCVTMTFISGEDVTGQFGMSAEPRLYITFHFFQLAFLEIWGVHMLDKKSPCMRHRSSY